MVIVKFFGVLRLDIKEKQTELEAQTLAELFDMLAKEYSQPRTRFSQCTVYINERPARARERLSAGDEIWLLAPAGGG